MTAKLSPDSIGLIFTMNATKHPVSEIASAAGCCESTVVRYLNAAGVILGNHGGRPRLVNGEYMAMALDMRAHGSTWYDVEKHIGFHRSTFQARIRAERTSA